MSTEHQEGDPGRIVGMARVAVGLVAGLVLWGLTESIEHKVWPATSPPMIAALFLLLGGVTFVLLGGLGAFRGRVLAIWTVAAGAVLAGIGAWEGFRGVETHAPFLSFPTFAAASASLFIAHHLIEAGRRDRRLIADFATYFELAWKHGVQLAMAVAFTGVFWLILNLGAAMFFMIGLKGFGDTIREGWFALPANGMAFGAAVHLADVRPALIRGVRMVALTLLGWLLPLLAVLGLAFLAALPFTGLKPLWETRSATAILLGAVLALVVLTNAAYQDGDPQRPVPLVLQWAMRLTGLLLLPLTGLAIYALALRIGQYGLTTERIIAAAWALVSAAHAIGYAIAAVTPGPVMRRLQATNIAGAWLALGVMLLLLSPIADPVSLSVKDQVARLKAGKVKPSEFDYKYLRFDGGRPGRAALDELAKSGGDVGRLAKETLALKARYERMPSEFSAVKVFPAGRTLPPGVKGLTVDPERCYGDPAMCTAVFRDLDGDGREEILYGSAVNSLSVFRQDADGVWSLAGSLEFPACNGKQILEGLKQGRGSVKPNPWGVLILDGHALAFVPEDPACKGNALLFERSDR